MVREAAWNQQGCSCRSWRINVQPAGISSSNLPSCAFVSSKGRPSAMIVPCALLEPEHRAQASPSFVQALFGTDKPTDDAAPLAASANAHAATLHALLARLQAERPQHAPLRVVAQGSQLQQQLFFGRLHAEGYEGFAMHLHGRDVASR